MDDESLRIRERNRAQQVTQILETEAFQEVVEAIKDDIWKQFPTATDLIALQSRLLGLNEILQAFETISVTGALATQQLADLEEEGRAKRDKPAQ